MSYREEPRKRKDRVKQYKGKFVDILGLKQRFLIRDI